MTSGFSIPAGFEMVEEHIGSGKTSRVSLLRRRIDGEHFAWKVPGDSSAATREMLAILVERSEVWHRIGVARGRARLAPDGTTVLQPFVEGRTLRSILRDTDLVRDPDDPLLPPLTETFRRMAHARVSVSGLNSENLIFDGDRFIVIDSGAIREWRSPWRAWAIQRRKITKHWIRFDGHSREDVGGLVARIESGLRLRSPTLSERLFIALKG